MSTSVQQKTGWPAMSLTEAHARLTAPGSRFEMEKIIIRGVPTRCWKHAPSTLRDVLVTGRLHGNRDFLVYEEERVDFESFWRAASAIAHELKSRGVEKGDRVAIIMRNLPEWAAAFYGAAVIGAIVTPLNAWWTGSELEYGLVDSGAKVVFVDSERLERITERLVNCRALERLYVSRYADAPPHPSVARLEDVVGNVDMWSNLPDRPLPDVRIEPDDDATILYTSGTTGKPKGALGTHRNMNSNIMAAGFSAARNFLRRGEPVPVIDPLQTPQRSALLSVPFFHATGSFAVLNPALYTGAKLVLMRKWDVETALQLIEREKINQAGGVPTIAWQLLEHPARNKYDLSSLESVAYGGAPSAPELVRKIVNSFPGSLPGNGWGMTETSATCTHHSGEDYEHRPESCGPAVAVCDLKLVGPNGSTPPPGEVGELWARGPNIVKGYWNKPRETAETFIDGWVRTGDLAKLDDEGFCTIVDRAKDMLIRGGENIYCVEVENTLYEHPAVMDVALVAVPHHTLGEEPAAVVHLRPGCHASEGELRAFVAGRLAAFKVPVKIVFWPESLPRNANGKIVKSELRHVVA
ncbi:MAG TPA: class I adenylate-forming enzyme family protein [Rhizomicrobium sp.]|jgi:long-chain acyl-CoA synthetase|nr:class I adenylate-forming enzyme family protein [Rhizomicrobium sp.]